MTTLDRLWKVRIGLLEVASGVRPPKGYMFSYYEGDFHMVVCHPVLISLFIRFARWMQSLLWTAFAPDILTKVFMEGYNQGHKDEIVHMNRIAKLHGERHR